MGGIQNRQETSISKISMKMQFLMHFITNQKNPQFSSVKFLITLHGPSGTAISVGDPISSLVPGNSFTNHSMFKSQQSRRLRLIVPSDPDVDQVLGLIALNKNQKMGF